MKNFLKTILGPNTFVLALILIAAGLPLSPFLISAGIVILVLNWLAEGNFKYKSNELFQNKALWAFCAIYIIHLVWLFITSDFQYGLKDIKIKLPLLLIPLVVATSEFPSAKSIRWIFGVFIASTIISTIIITLIVFGFIDFNYTDIRHASIFISHIRLSLYIALIVIALLYAICENIVTFKATSIAIIIWLISFLVLLQAMTGIVVLLITSTLLFFIFYYKKSTFAIRLLAICVFVLLFVSCAIYIRCVYQNFINFDTRDTQNLATKTINGNPYIHNSDDPNFENGHWTGYFYCAKELENEWVRRSNFPIDSLDRKSQPIRYTLMKYMTSLDLKKDSVGIWALSDMDIRSIEDGTTNFIANKKFSLYSRIYIIIEEFYWYNKGRLPVGNSVTQRFLFGSIALEIIKKNPLLGVGTGDVSKSYAEVYKIKYPTIPEKFRLRAHNQFLTFAIAFGIPAMLIIIVFFLFPVFSRKKDFLQYSILIIMMLSFVNEDTLETQSGATFFALFYALFVFAKSKST